MRVFDSRKLLLFSGLLLIVTLAVQGASSKETAVVKDVSVNASGNSVEVKIAANQRADYTYFELANPRRLVVDFHGFHNDIGFREKAIDAAGVQRVRTSNFADKKRKVTRVVFDLTSDVSYAVEQTDEIVRVWFGDRMPGGEIQPAEAKQVETKPLEPETEPQPENKATVNLIADSTSRTPPSPPQPKPSSSVPHSLVSKSVSSPVTVTGAPQQTAPAPNAPGQTPASQYTGEIVSIDVQDLDIKSFFRFIADVSGLNVVLDPSVSGAVTLTLTDVPWDQALDIVLKTHGLGSELQGNVLRIATRASLVAEENAREAERKAIEGAVPLTTKSYILNYRKAADVATTLRTGSFISARGSITPDVQRNALIIQDIPDQFGRLDQVIQFLDTPAQQVEIEARLLSANKSFSRELGNQLGLLLGNNSQNKLSGVQSVGISPITSRVPAPSVGGSLPLNVNLPAAGTSGLSFVLGAGANTLLDEIITAAEAKGTAKIISRPHVITQNNQAATIQQGTQIPVQTNQNNTISVQFLNFALRLTATPQITNVGTILLNVQIENSQPDFARAVSGIPSVATQSVNTSILMGDGETLVLGGILVDQDTNNIRQVPGFGSIPLIGNLFKDTQIIKSTAELLFFITPRIQSSGNLSVTPPAEKPPGDHR